MTVDDLKIIHAGLNMNDPCDAAVYACTVITFYCIARLGKFTVPNIREKFEPAKYITHGNISMQEDKDGLPVMKFRLPITKCEATGEDIQCAPQVGYITNPENGTAKPSTSQPGPTRRPPICMEAPQKWTSPIIQNTSHEQTHRHSQKK